MTCRFFLFYDRFGEKRGGKLPMSKIIACLEGNPVIAAVGDDKWQKALESPAEVIFYMSASLRTIRERVRQAHEKEKYVMVHIDLAEGIGKDRVGIGFLADCGVDGILSTKAQMIRMAKEKGLFAIQRFFVMDSSAVDSIQDMYLNTHPHLIEIMPGVVPKVIRQLTQKKMPVIAGGLVETKSEVTDALGAGATAVSTGKPELWYL